MRYLRCSTRRTERRNQDSMNYTARLRGTRNEVMCPKNAFIEALFSV